MKNFFVRGNDATQIKLLKLEILTNLANEANITFILREFQTYISSQDRDLVAATIQAIGRLVKFSKHSVTFKHLIIFQMCSHDQRSH